MGCLGVHYALSNAEVEHLRSLSEEELRDFIIEGNLDDRDEDYQADSDKAWDAMHRALTDGTLTWDGGEYPLNHVVLGGELLYTESDDIVSLKSPRQVHDIAAALACITEAEFRDRYFAVDPEAYGFPVEEQDFDYTWGWFENVRRLYMRADAEDVHVLFTASQ